MAEYDNRLEELAGVHNARDCVEGFVRAIVDQYVRAVVAYVIETAAQMVNRLCTSSEDAYGSIQLPFSYTVAHRSVFEDTSGEVRSPVPSGQDGGVFASTNPSTPDLSKTSFSPTKGTCGSSKKAHR